MNNLKEIISHVHWAYNYLGPFGVLWVHMAGHKNCVKKKIINLRWKIKINNYDGKPEWACMSTWILIQYNLFSPGVNQGRPL